MKSLQIGIRKHTERMKVRYWLLINAQAIDSEKRKKSFKFKSKSSKRWQPISLYFIDDPYWILFVVITVIVNMLITINSFPYYINNYFIQLAIVVHLTCLMYWIDFLVAIAIKISNKSNVNYEKTRKIGYFIMDAISLLPLSIAYLLVVPKVNYQIFWLMRCITLVRCYRIPLFLSKVSTVERSHWKVLLFTYTFYAVALIDLFANYWIMQKNIEYDIYGWNASVFDTFIVAFYFSCVTCLNVGFGDITPQTPFQIIACCLVMISGFIITTGVLTGAIATGLTNGEKRRENYRLEYESMVSALKKSKIDKKIVDKISDNLINFWNYKKGLTNASPVPFLPLSLQKEIYFDLNFGFLNRSLIFSLQPRSFLRSVSLMMKNVSFFPGDIIMEPFGMSEAMMCISTGIIEILSDENDDSPLISFTTGTIIGEASLFMSIPIKYVIRASTNVELQVLTKGNFSKLALKYNDIYRSMRSEIITRIEISDKASLKDMDKEIYEMSKRKSLKYLLNELKKSKNFEPKKEENTYFDSYKTNLLNLYVLSENIPRVKTLPINLIKASPWILRPNTTLTEVWNIFIVLTVVIVCYVYPCIAGFIRKVDTETFIFFIFIEIIYIIDLYIQFTTAIERNDRFSYITTIEQIVAHKLKSVQFYVDILATYDLTVYAKFIIPQNPDHAISLLSLNRLLKFWIIPRYFFKLENNMTMNLLLLRTIKYLYYYSVVVVWSSAILFLEACPEETCNDNRWYAILEVKEVNESNPSPRTPWPEIISLYWGSVIVSAVGYGDLVPKAIADVWAVLFCLILGIIVVIYCTAEASATLKHLERQRTHYQEEVLAVNRFMTDHEISEDLQNEVRNYFRTQWNYDKAFSLKHHQTIETMMTQQKEIYLTEMMKKFLTVPVFQQADTDFLKLVAKSSKIRVLPPNEVVANAGSFVRELYILENGYCEVSANENVRSIIGPLTPFGYLEMILGIPQMLNVRTLTHARIMTLEYTFYLRAATKHANVKSQIDFLTNKMYSNIQESENPLLIFANITIPIETVTFKNDTVNSFLSGQFINVYRYHMQMNTSYWEPFRRWGKLRILQFFLIPVVLSPHGLFLKIWATLRIISVFLIGLIVPIHFSLFHYTKEYENIIYVFQVFSWLDIYLMFHVAYYDRRGLLMFHPAKTATWYLKNSFILDFITTFPFYLITRALFSKNEVPTYYYNGPGFLMALQFYKFFQACHYLESDILEALPSIKILKFVPLSLIVTNIITGFLIFLECETAHLLPIRNITVKDLKSEFEKSIQKFCTKTNRTDHPENGLSPLRFYLLAYYWVTTTMTTCGFGDITAHDKTTMITVMIIIVLGLFIYGYMFASLTSSMISVYNSVTKYRRRMREMSIFMKQMNANNDIQQRLILHYEYNWHRAEGANPQKMFLYVHGALRETIVTSMYEETIRQVPAFIDVERSVIRILGKLSEEVYFLSGEIIMKYNDVQEYVYIIYRGKVDVRSPQGKYITSMGSGGIFGNITRNPFALSSVTVIATRNVDILRLNSEMFFKALEIFPNTKALVEFFNTRTTDYIKPLETNRENFHDSGRNTTHLKSKSRVDTIPYEKSLRQHRPLFQYSDVAPSDEENYFYFKNSIFLLNKKKFFGMVVLHDSWLNSVIEIFFFFIAYLSSTLTFYMFTFQDFSNPIIIMSYILDALFALKIIYQINLSYSDKYGNYVVNKQSIKKRYVRDKKMLALDITSNLPLDIFALMAPLKYQLLSLSILRLNRLLRLYYNYEFYNSKSRNLMTNKIYLKLSWLLFNSILFVHTFACIWYFITCPFGYKQNLTWVTTLDMSNATNLKLYILSCYYITTVITTTGYGDVRLTSTTEIIFSTVFMIISRFTIALIAGSMAAVISVHSLNLFLYQEKISDLKEHFKRQNLSAYQLDKFRRYAKSLWLQESLKKIPKFIETAPHVMKCEVMNSMFGHHLSQCYVFTDVDEYFLMHLSTYLKRNLYFSGNYIVQQGDIDNTMYFINKGQVSVLAIHLDMTETIYFTLKENDHFGMEQGLIIGKPHYFSYRAESDVEILSLTLNHWQRLNKYFPQASQKIYQKLRSLPQQNENLVAP